MVYRKSFFVGFSLITVVFALLLVACARPTPTPTPKPTPTATPVPLATPTPTPRPTPTPVKGEGRVVIYGQGGWETFLVTQFIPKFEKESSCKVTYFAGISSPMLARVKAEAGKPTLDVVNMDTTPNTEAKMLGLLEKNNRDILTNLKFVHPKALAPDDIGVPFVILGGPVIAVRHDKLQEKNLPMPQSWLDVANPAYKGKVGLTEVSATPTISFIAHVARALGGNEINDYVRAFEWMESKLKPNVLAIATLPEWRKLLQEGSIWVGVGSWSRAAEAASQGAPVTLVWAKEGNNVDFNNLAVVKGAEHPICGQLWMNYALSKEVQEAMPENTLRGPVRTDAAITEKVKDLIVTPAHMDRAVELNREAISKNSPDWIDRWNRVFAK